MKKTILKSLLLGAAALTALTASAENKVWIEDFTITPGYTEENADYHKIFLNNDDPVGAWQLFMTLPAGLKVEGTAFPAMAEKKARYPYVEDEDGFPTFEHTDATNQDEFNEGTVEDFRIVVTTMKGHNLKGNSGTIYRIKFKADETFAGGDIKLTYFKSDYWIEGAAAGEPTNGSWELTNCCTVHVSVPVAATPLADIVASGVNDNEYVVADPLYVVTKSDKAHCVFVTDGPVKGNWMKIYAEGDVYNAIADMEIIQEGTLKGKLSEASGNQQLTVTTAPTEGEPDESLKVEPKEWNLAQDVPGSDDWHFAPKVNEVIALTGYWQDNAFSGYHNNGGQVVTASMAWCDTEIEMVSNGWYKNVVSAVQLKPTNGSKAESDLPYTKYIVYPTTVEEDNVVTGVENLKGDKAVVSVQYVNVAGQVANTPFQGVNMVVTRYADGSTVTTKVIK